MYITRFNNLHTLLSLLFLRTYLLRFMRVEVRFYLWRLKFAVAYTFPLTSKLLSLKSETSLHAT